jgi:SAM-dependent methyltransferase
LGRDPESILDIGAGGGAHLARYGTGVLKYCVEPSAAALPLLKARSVECLGAYADDVADCMRFDAVTLLDVLEHVVDPAGLLDEAVRLTGYRGVIGVVTGDIDSWVARFAGPHWAYLCAPEHCSFFSARGLERYMADTHGWSVALRWRTGNQDVDMRYVFRFLRGCTKEAVLRAMPSRMRGEYERAGRATFPLFIDQMLLVFRRVGP